MVPALRLALTPLLALCAPLALQGQAPLRFVDIAHQSRRQVVVDRQRGQYLGHPTTVLLEDGKTIIAVYPMGHGRGAIVMKRSSDGGLTWSPRLPVPDNWSTSLETPTIHRTIGNEGKLLILFSGLYPARLATSSDDGSTWTQLRPVGDWIAWVGTYDDVVKGNPGQYRIRLMDNLQGADCGYPGVELLPDGTFVLTSYGHWSEGEEPYIVSVRVNLGEFDR